MAFKNHPRHITDEQFAEGTTIDGSRIDSAMDDVVSHVNNVPKGDIETRYVQTQFVAGWAPNIFSTVSLHQFPWLPSINSEAETEGEQPLRRNNPLRLKSCEIPGMNRSQINEARDKCNIWMTPIHFGAPVIVQAIHIIGGKDTVSSPRVTGFTEDFLYNTTTPLGYAVGEKDEGLSVVMHVDHPFAPEDRTQNSVELSRNRFAFVRGQFTTIAWPAASAEGTTWNDMRPKTFPGGGPGGFAVVMDDLNVPVAAGSRVRLSVQIPPSQANIGNNAYTNAWGARPQEATYWSATITCLEEIV
jgi:hypothetical protein